MRSKKWKSQFAFDRSQRVGILLLLAVITGLLYVQFFVSFSEESTFDYSSAEMRSLQAQVDSLRCAELDRQQPKIRPFNPNFMSDYRAYTLGISPEAYDRLKAFREQGLWVNSVEDFKRVTQLPDSVVARIQPYFKFPDWITNPRPRKQYTAAVKAELPFSEKKDLNTVTEKELQGVSGIGEVLSVRILEKRSQLGGFSDDRQLHLVWGLKPEVIERIGWQFTVKTPKTIQQLNINHSSASDLATLPGISFDLGKEIWEFVRLREGVSSLSELLKIDGITERNLQLFELYLYAE